MKLPTLVRTNRPAPTDPDAAYLAGYRAGRAAERAATAPLSVMVEAQPGDPDWPDAARWTGTA